MATSIPRATPRPHPGLCAACRWAARVDSSRGSTFLRCGRSDTDPRYPRYPALPVRQCDGFEGRPAETSAILDS